MKANKLKRVSKRKELNKLANATQIGVESLINYQVYYSYRQQPIFFFDRKRVFKFGHGSEVTNASLSAG